MWDWIKTIGSGVGSALDWLGDNQWLTESITRLAMDNPELDYDKLMEMAIQEAVINSPDVFTPQGATTWDIDPETGKRTVTQQYSPEVQGLYEMLVRNAGADINAYQAPEGMTGQMLGKMINDRETHLGLPSSEYQRPDFRREGATAPQGNYWDEDDEESDPSLRPDRDVDQDVVEGTPDFSEWRQEGWTGEQNQRFDEIVDFINQGNWDDRFSGGQTDWTQIINDYVGAKGDTAGPFEEFLIEHADEIGSAIGGLAGPLGSGEVLNRFIDFATDKGYWDQGGTFENRITPNNPYTGMPNRPIDDLIDAFVGNEYSPVGGSGSSGGSGGTRDLSWVWGAANPSRIKR